MSKSKIIFITGTDTAVGKTITSHVLGVLFKSQGFTAGVLKPAQCAGRDAHYLKKALELEDDLKAINPFYALEPLSPHLAFRRAKIKFNVAHVKECLNGLTARYDIVLVEGAGGLMVPLQDDYYNADLAHDLKAELIIVARLGLGTINHTLLTINEANRRKLKIRGVLFCQTRPGYKTLPEITNPQEIQKLSGVKVLGTIPYLKPLNTKNILHQCQKLKLI